MNTTFRTIALLTPLAVVLACGTGPDRTVSSLLADRFDNAEWSTPVNLGPMVNSSAVDANAFLSPNEHELLFVSSRTGGFGLQDIWVTHRQCLSCRSEERRVGKEGRFSEFP